MVARYYRVSGRSLVFVGDVYPLCTYRGLYFALHMKGPAALPMQYADSIMELVVTLFVCPAVVCDTQDKANTKLEAPVTDHGL